MTESEKVTKIAKLIKTRIPTIVDWDAITLAMEIVKLIENAPITYKQTRQSK